MKSLLVIAGFEANGFAGLLTDMQVAIQLGLSPCAIATSLTAQSVNRLVANQATDPLLLQQQLYSLELLPEVIKIGLVPNRALASVIADWLHDHYSQPGQPGPQPPLIVLDPVASSSGDRQSFGDQSLAEILSPLWPWVSLLTPNIEELQQLASEPSHPQAKRPTLQDPSHGMTTEAAWVERCYWAHPGLSADILVTGGHSESGASEVTDTLYNRAGISGPHWSQQRFAYSLRGTGCYLSTAIACALCHNYSQYDAITVASAMLHSRYRASWDGHRIRHSRPDHLPGWPVEPEVYPTIGGHNKQVDSEPVRLFPAMTIRHGLYPIVESPAWVERMALIGITTLQLRIKHQPIERVRAQIAAAVQIAQRYQLQLFINDYWQLAIEYQAYGVHLGQADLLDADLTAIARAGLRLGISTHGDFEFQTARQLNPSYLAVGAIFPTVTKDMSGKLQGLTRLARFRALEASIPIVAIGGIYHHNIQTVLATGVDMVAVVSAISLSDWPERSAEQLQHACLTFHKES